MIAALLFWNSRARSACRRSRGDTPVNISASLAGAGSATIEI